MVPSSMYRLSWSAPSMSDSASYSGRRYGSTFSLSVPGRKPEVLLLDGGTGQYDAPDLPVLESTYRFGYGKIGFAGGRAGPMAR